MSKKIIERDMSRLKGTERVRKRPSVILGSDGIRGVQQTLFEVVSNSIDRFKVGFGNKITITRLEDYSFKIEDEADGLPCGWNEKENAYNWDLALRIMYGGDNYGKSEEVSGKIGNFGLGLSATTMTSERMTIVIHKNDKKYTIKFKKGRPLHKITEEFVYDDIDDTLPRKEGDLALLVEKNTQNLTGTTTIYRPDPTVFTDINVPSEWIQQKLKRQAVVNNGLTIIFNDELEKKEFSYHYDTISDYVNELGQEQSISDNIIFEGNAEGKDVATQDSYKVEYISVIQFNKSISKQEYFHNSSELTELGTNVTTDAIKSSLTAVIHNYLTTNKLYNKGETKIKYNDIEDSLIVVLSSKSNETSYSNQTKLSIDNKFIKEFITNDIKEKLNIYFIENKLEATHIINQILINKRANDKAEKTKLDIKSKLQQKNNKGLSQKIEGLKHCNFRKSKVEERILLLDEGLSANSTITSSFDNRIMGAYGLKGRFINSLKSSVTDVLNNVPAMGVISALGCGIEIPKEEKKKFKDMKTFNIDDLNYGKVGILCDADCWGKGINLSLLTFFKRFMPTLLKEGRIYLVISPRFEIELKDGTSEYAYNDEDKVQKIAKIGENKVKAVTIRKGLGEFNKDEFYELVLSEEARKKAFIQVKYNENEELINEYFDKLMGENIEGRKQFIKDNIINIDLSEVE